MSPFNLPKASWPRRRLHTLRTGVSYTTPLLPMFALAAVWILASYQPSGPAQALLPAASNTYTGLTYRASAGCGGCHTIDPLFSHPVGVKPSMHVPEFLPLEDGVMTCVTCHQMPDPQSHLSAKQRRDPLLRTVDSGQTLCIQCHSTQDGTRKSMHGMGLNRAHLHWPDKPAGLLASERGMDAESLACLSCHDGTVAKDINHGSGLGLRGLKGTDHPVGAAYTERREFGKVVPTTVLTPPATLDARIRLFDNHVGCGSCHSAYSPHEALLVMPNTRSRLCLSCHAGI